MDSALDIREMGEEMKASNCSSGVAVDLYWRDCGSKAEEGHIEAMVNALFEALNGPERRWNPITSTHCKALFRRLLKKAARGEVVPVDEVKSLRSGRDSLFELRWEGLDVLEVDGEQRRFLKTGARLIHAEPAEVSLGMVGLLAHEKPHQSDSKEIQECFIAEAERIYNEGIGRLWGITLRKN